MQLLEEVNFNHVCEATDYPYFWSHADMLCPTADYAEEYYDDLVNHYYGQAKNNDALVTSVDDLTIKVDYLAKNG
jgi:hypothetical protein